MLLSFLLVLLLAVVLNEALAELLAKSGFFSPLRAYVFDRADTSPFFKFVGLVLACPYCTSVWTSLLPVGLVAAYAFYYMNAGVVAIGFGFVPSVLIVHRLSNHFHNISDRYFVKEEK